MSWFLNERSRKCILEKRLNRRMNSDLYLLLFILWWFYFLAVFFRSNYPFLLLKWSADRGGSWGLNCGHTTSPIYIVGYSDFNILVLPGRWWLQNLVLPFFSVCKNCLLIPFLWVTSCTFFNGFELAALNFEFYDTSLEFYKNFFIYNSRFLLLWSQM